MAIPASLRRFHLEGVSDTDRVIGNGSYAVVKELEFWGLRCAEEKLHAVLYESASREERANMLRRWVVGEFERRRESVNKIGEGHPLFGLIEQCLSNVASRRPNAAEVARQLQTEHAQVLPESENRLELLSSEQQQNSAEVNEALRRENVSLRRENEAVRADMAGKDAEIEVLRQNSSSQQVMYELDRRTLQAQRADLVLSVERSQSETESLRAQVQRLTMQLRVPPPETNGMQVRMAIIILCCGCSSLANHLAQN